MADVALGCQDPNYRVVSLTEDYCLSPDKPVGYMIHQTLDQSIRQTPSVLSRNYCILNENSRTIRVLGNEAGVGGGVVSKTNMGMCRPSQAWAEKVFAEGGRIIAHNTVMQMNSSGPEAPHNVEGVILAKEGAAEASVPDADDKNKWNDRGYLKKEWLEKNAKKETRDVSYTDAQGKTVTKQVDVYEVDGPLHNRKNISGFSTGTNDNYVVVRKDSPLDQQLTEIHEIQHWKDKQIDPKMPPHQSEINARQAELDWGEQQKDGGVLKNEDIESNAQNNREENKIFEQLGKDPSQMSKDGLSPSLLKQIVGVYCDNNYAKQDRYKEQCEVLSEYDKEFDNEAKEEEIRKKQEALAKEKENLERFKKMGYDKKPLFQDMYNSTARNVERLEGELSQVTNGGIQ